jgi:outer membrane biosynthesis protein TonB
MHVLAALADAPTAVLAVAAILLGLFVVARGRRGEGADDEAGSSLLSVPLKVPIAATADGSDAADADEDGLQKMAVGEVGHGAIRLGPLTRRPEPEPEPEPASQLDLDPEPASEPDPEPDPEPPEPDPPLDPPVSWTAQPAPPLPSAEPEAGPDAAPAPEDPAAAAPPPTPPAPFRQGRIRLRKPPG